MWWFSVITVLQTILFVELGLLFIRVLGNPRRSKWLGQPCGVLQYAYVWVSHGLGYLFLLLGIYTVALAILQYLVLWPST